MAVAAVAAALTVVAAVLIAALGPRDSAGQPSSALAPNSRAAAVVVTASDVQRVHEALHDIDARCSLGRPGGGDLEHDAGVILDFAQRYPDARFPIDDETGRTLSLLMTAREGLDGCAPAVAARIDAALPPQYRRRPATRR